MIQLATEAITAFLRRDENAEVRRLAGRVTALEEQVRAFSLRIDHLEALLQERDGAP
ncbi:hypothetical protein [Actinomadura rudentiformis]|uniref:hypothetical protein n=1 Tax=Actinomadura rudentiformis TaxID=359158 RepID=UPI00178C247D|nr:hypothetical protein [Actinomadura rudentiformis]